MKVLIVNTFDRGGAANSCLRLHRALLESVTDSKVLLRDKTKRINQTIPFNQPPVQFSLIEKIQKKIVRILKQLKILKTNTSTPENKFIASRRNGLEMFSFPNSPFDITECKEYQDADIINLHWVANFLDYRTFFERNTKPVVWTLHDMNPFTGGEHYLEKYLGIDEEGFPQKRILSVEELQNSDKNQYIKKKALLNCTNLTIVAPSQWLANEAKKSELFKSREVVCIPYGLDSDIFAPRDKQYSRNLLNIPLDKKVILFVADSISNNRKGFVFLKKAFEQLEMQNVVLCAIGNKNSELESVNNIIELGPIYDERLMSIVYSAADVFVIPSLMDNLPNTVLESLMCGTPVIGFPVGGIVDMVQHGENGMLTKDISVKSLLESLQEFLKSDSVFDSSQIRINAVKKYDLKVQALEYKKIFETILANTNN
ncbi:glycosyltransferase [Flavobacterium hiemivividum]|uniref:Glycosyltransferase n=1 Tax=Flavobacterium hiemivividum TaxID=2541734 RepID=A0A4R5D2R8_9FLAO|nr:glycosyltransferase [Flavobacterium hiemivividum]TDE04575.1 glycosyltransferase [Flavobacterium hiemivividum]